MEESKKKTRNVRKELDLWEKEKKMEWKKMEEI